MDNRQKRTGGECAGLMQRLAVVVCEAIYTKVVQEVDSLHTAHTYLEKLGLTRWVVWYIFQNVAGILVTRLFHHKPETCLKWILQRFNVNSFSLRSSKMELPILVVWFDCAHQPDSVSSWDDISKWKTSQNGFFRYIQSQENKEWSAVRCKTFKCYSYAGFVEPIDFQPPLGDAAPVMQVE